MASPHHHHCHHPASCYCHCCYPTYTPYQHHHPPPPPPPPPPPDPYLHHHPPHPYSPPSHLPNLPQHFQEHYLREERQPHPTVSSLLHRIAALESALSRRSSPSQSLRDAAARTIQAHFRAFLLRRSITLRQLKDLASIKSALGVLKSSCSEKTLFDYQVIYRKAMDLLLKLDTIQGGDPLIRNGKSSVSRELNNFLDFLEGACVQRRAGVNVRQSGNNVKSRVSDSERKIGNVKSGCLKRANMEKLRGLVERIDRLAEELHEEEGEVVKSPNNDSTIRKTNVPPYRTRGLLKQHDGVEPKVKKNVSFVEDGKVYKVLRRHSEPYLEECSNDSIDRDDSVNDDDDDDDEENEIEDDLCREIEEIGVSSEKNIEEESEEGSLLSSDGEKDSRGYSKMTRRVEDDTGDFIFSAPLPVTMESRGNSIDKRKKLGNN